MLYDYNKSRGVETTGIHRYRHTFAKQWILNGGNVVFPFINVPEEWINDFLGIEKEYAVDYDNDDIAESFMGFLGDINSQFKENVLATSSFLEEKHQ